MISQLFHEDAVFTWKDIINYEHLSKILAGYNKKSSDSSRKECFALEFLNPET